MKIFKSSLASLCAIFGLSALASAAVPVCADYNGTWTGTCTRVGVIPTTATRTVNLTFAADCSVLTATGLGVVSFGSGFRVGKDMTRLDSDTVNPAIETHMQRSAGVQWDATNGRIVVPQTANTVSYINSAGLAVRTITTVNYRVKLKNDGTLQSQSDTIVRTWTNGDKIANANLSEDCVLTPVP